MSGKRLNVLIISTNRNKYPLAVLPFGACLVAEAASAAGHDVRMLDLMFASDPVRTVKNELDRSRPDIIGISIRNIDNNDLAYPINFIKETIPIIDLIRKSTDARIVLGGAALGIMPEEILRFTDLPLAVAGNGEKSFTELLSRVAEGKSFDDIPGIALIKDAVFRKNSPSGKHNSICVEPDFKKWVDVKSYIAHLSSVPVQSKRGCPYKCIYCTYSISEGDNYCLFTPDSVVESVKKLVLKGINEIEFVDNVFNSPYEHAVSICEGLIKAKVKARFHTVELNPRFVDDKLLSLMGKAGFKSIGITAESASDIVLKNLRKDYNSEHVLAAALAIKKNKIPCFWMFMLGGPGETKETITETLRFAAEYIKPADVVFFNVGIRIYPGTELEKIARDSGLLRLTAREMLEPVSYISPLLDTDWLTGTLKESINKHMNFMSSEAMHFKFLPLIYRLSHLLGFKAPLWRFTPYLRRCLKLTGAKI